VTWFRVTVTGTGFRKSVDGIEGRYSFLTYHFVDAETPEAALEAAAVNVASREELRGQLDDRPEPRLGIEEIVLCDSSDVAPTELGLIWYPDPASEA